MKLAVLNDHVFHFVSFQEYLLSQGEDNNDWFVLVYCDAARPDLSDLYERYLQKVGWSNYRIFSYRLLPSKLRLLDKVRMAIAMVIYLASRFKQVSFSLLLVGNYRSTVTKVLTKLLRVNDIVVMDEGNSTIAIAESRRTNLSSDRQQSIDADVARPGNVQYTFFTRYTDLVFGPNDRLVSCDYTHVLDGQNSSLSDTSTVLFLGCPFPEIGVVDREVYLAYVLAIDRQYKAREIVMQYKPHRAETKERLQQLVSRGVFVVTDNWPIEIYLMDLGQYPLHVASFFTSAFATISAIFQNRIELVAYQIEKQHVLDRHKWVSNQYRYYADHSADLNISVLQINDPLKQTDSYQ